MVEMFGRGYINTRSGFEPNLHQRQDASRFHHDGLRYAPNFANPAARQVIKERILKPYIDAGVDAWWNDLSDAHGDWGRP